jgi:hypothetical protein
MEMVGGCPVARRMSDVASGFIESRKIPSILPNTAVTKSSCPPLTEQRDDRSGRLKRNFQSFVSQSFSNKDITLWTPNACKVCRLIPCLLYPEDSLRNQHAAVGRVLNLQSLAYTLRLSRVRSRTAGALLAQREFHMLLFTCFSHLGGNDRDFGRHVPACDAFSGLSATLRL